MLWLWSRPPFFVLHVRGIILFMEVMFFARDRKLHCLRKLRFTRGRSPFLVEVIIRIWYEVERFLFLSRKLAKCYEITTLPLVKYEYLPRLWSRNTKRYVMTVTEAAILQEILLRINGSSRSHRFLSQHFF